MYQDPVWEKWLAFAEDHNCMAADSVGLGVTVFWSKVHGLQYWAAAVAGKGKRRLLKEDHVKAEILSFHVYG